MATCFIFVKYLTTEGCLSLKLSPQGDIEAPLAERLFHDIALLQVNAYTIIVVSTDLFSLHRVELPWLADKKARAAIPYALEDKLADNIDELHFAFDRSHYQNGHYLVAVGKIAYLAELITTLKNHHIAIDIITLDWFALADNEVCMLDASILIHDHHVFLGALSLELAPFYLNQMQNQTLFTFTNSDSSLILPANLRENEDSSLWLAKRLQTNKLLNLSQGVLQPSNIDVKTKRWYYAAIAMSLAWLLTFFTINMIKINSLTQQINTADSQIATIYRQFFPNAPKVISPRFRITQLLKINKAGQDDVFWLLLNQLASVIPINKATVEQLRFQNQVLQVTVVCNDFDALEALQLALQHAHISVKQSQASSHEGRVMATLELNV